MSIRTSSTKLDVTEHARRRINARGLPARSVEVVCAYGREVHTRGAIIFVIGRKELNEHGENIELRVYEGIHVVCSREGVALTAYRNHDLRGLRPRKRRYRARRNR